MKWQILNPDLKMVSRLQKEFDCSEIIARVLANRGINSLQESRPFFNPALDHLHDPFLMRDMDRAVERVIRNIDDQKPILVFGDFDVDGTSGAAMLYLALNSLGAKAVTYIPDRESEGYGLSKKGIDTASEIGSDLIITCDCGINAFEQVDYARSIGIDVLITDHHTPDENLPNAIAVLNPKRSDCAYPFKGLCGGGVAFKLVSGVAESLGKSFDSIMQFLDLVTLGTTADLVPIRDENRVIVHYGLREMKSRSKAGLNQLLTLAGLEGKIPSVGQLVFGIAPRINAAGRLGDANRSVKLLTTDDEDIARGLAGELDRENRRRQEIQQAVVDDALRKVNSEIDLEKEKAIVLAGKGWHPGVVGIVASRLKEEFSRPAVVISLDEEGFGKGSARSVKGLDLYETLTAVKKHLDGYGGHPMAAGLTVTEENLPRFKADFVREANTRLAESDLQPTLILDGELKLNDINPRFMDFLEKLGPYGPSNMRPKFMARTVGISGNPRVIGNGDHLRFTAKQRGSSYNAVGFNLSDHYQDLVTHKPIDLAFVVEINEWKGSREIQLNVRDIRPSS